MTMKGEFEDRNYQHDAEGSTAGMGGAGLAQSHIDAAPSGSPEIDYDVRSIYNSRPINAYDFNLISTGVMSNDGLGGPNFADIGFQVRQGYVMVPNRMHHWIAINAFPSGNREDLCVTVRIDGGDVLDNVNIPVGVASDDLVRLFLTLNEFQVISFHFTTPNTAGGSFPNFTMFVHLYGTYLFKTGRPASLEIANQMSGAGRGGQSIASHVAPTTSVLRSEPTLPPAHTPMEVINPVAVLANPPPPQLRLNPCVHFPPEFYRMSITQQRRYLIRNKCISGFA